MAPSSPTGKRRRLPPEARRRQLLDCAVRACADQGIGRVSHAGVAARAGVSVATVFHYFPSRPDLVAAVLDETRAFFLQLAEAAHGTGGTAAERLVSHGRAFLAAAQQREDLIRVWLDWSTAIRADTWPGYLDFQERLVEIVAGSIAREPPAAGRHFSPQIAARLFVGNAHMAALMHFAPDSGLDLDEHIERTVALLLGGRQGPAT